MSLDNNNNRFNIFNFYNRDGKGVEKGTELNVLEKPGIKNFFKLLGRQLRLLFSVNLFIVFGNFPFFFILLGITGYTSVDLVSPGSGLYSVMKGSEYLGAPSSPVFASLKGVFGKQVMISLPTTLTYILFALGALMIFTFGIVNVGCTYLLRNMIRGEHVFAWKDFWYAVKKNFKQAIIFGIIDSVISILLVYDLLFFRSKYNSVAMFYYISFAMILIYFFMRMYIYPMIITFDLSIFKMFKNAILFTVLGIKRNLMCLLGVVLIVLINFGMFLAYPPIGLVLPFIITMAILKYMSVYCAYPVIKQYMIDPYYKEIKKKEESEPPEEAAEAEE